MADNNSGRRGKDPSVTDLLLHPELLSREFIQLVLHEKNIGAEQSGEASRDQLTELYLQHVIPLPQRELPSSRWGRRVGQSRSRSRPGAPHGGCHSSSSGENARKRPLIVFDGSSTRTGAIKLKKPEPAAGGDRLKPPPCGPLSSPVRRPPGDASKSPAGNGRTASPTSPTATVRLKRQANSERECDGAQGELRSPEVKKKIQHVTWP